MNHHSEQIYYYVFELNFIYHQMLIFNLAEIICLCLLMYLKFTFEHVLMFRGY